MKTSKLLKFKGITISNGEVGLTNFTGKNAKFMKIKLYLHI